MLKLKKTDSNKADGPETGRLFLSVELQFEILQLAAQRAVGGTDTLCQLF